MKRILCAVAAVIFTVSLCSCSSAIKLPESSHTADSTLVSNAEQALDDMKQINLLEAFTPSDSMKSKVTRNGGNATSDIDYYDGDKLVCTVYKGYGENSFRLYKTAANGDKIEVLMTDDGDKRSSVFVECKSDGKTKYTVDVTAPKGKRLSLKDDFRLTAFKSGDVLDEYYYYECASGELKLVNTRFFDADGRLMSYDASSDDNFTVIEITDGGALIGGKSLDELPELSKATYIGVKLGMGERFLRSKDKSRWFIDSTALLEFDDMSARDALADRLSECKAYVSTASGKTVYRIEVQCTLDITDADCSGYGSLGDFIEYEFNDPLYLAVSFAADGNVKALGSLRDLDNVD